MTVRELLACLTDVPEAQRDEPVLLRSGREVAGIYPFKTYDGRYPFKMYDGKQYWELS